jgi:flagellar FliL protein
VLQGPCQTRKEFENNALAKITWLRIGQKTAAGQASPGKKFPLPLPLKVSVNHSRRSFEPRAPRDAPRLCPAFVPLRLSSAIQDNLMASKPKKADLEDAEDEAAGGATEAGETSKSKWIPKLSLKTMIIAAAALLVVGGGGAGAYFFFSPHKAPAEHVELTKPAVFVDLPDVLVNLANSGSDRTQYLKVKITLEVPDQIQAQKITPVMPRVMDAFQTYLRELRPTDLDGSAGLYRLKEELTRRVNVAIAPSRINAVLFKEIVVQ